MQPQMRSNEMNTRTGKSKVQQYRWELKDKPGELVWLHKTALRVDHDYQRHGNQTKAIAIAQRWSYVACGVIVVAKRTTDQGMYVIDGQHRVLAALKRDDVQQLPCIVFESDGPKQEAAGFMDANTQRRMPTSQEKWRAQMMRGDQNTLFVNALITQAGRTVSNCAGPTTVRCLTSLLRAADSDREALGRLWPLVVELSVGKVLHERIFDGLFWLETHLPDDESLVDRRWRERVLRVGYDGLLEAAHKAAAYFTRGGNKVWGTGMLEAMNKGCRIHMQLRSED